MNVRLEQEPDDSAKGESWPTRRRRRHRFGQHDKGEKQQWRRAKTFRTTLPYCDGSAVAKTVAVVRTKGRDKVEPRLGHTPEYT